MSRPLSDSAPERGKGKVQVSTSVPVKVREGAIEIAKRRNVSLSEVVTVALKRYIAEDERLRRRRGL